MDERVPGGRARSASPERYIEEEEEDRGSYSHGKLNHKHRQVSQSLPRFGGVRKTSEHTDDSSLLNQSLPVEKEKKRSFKKSVKSLGSFMQKLARHMSVVALNTSGNKPSSNNRPKRSRSVTTHDRKRSKENQESLLNNRPNNLHTSTLQFKYKNGEIPGVLGLRNHGNTCFMNAILQCLSHTDSLAEYFVAEHYKNDLKRHNKVNSKKFGTKGELTEQLAVLLRSLWSCKYTPEISNNFKTVVGKYGAQYKGYAQHDAQEFLLWLLDKVHEDLNIATKKKYRPNKSSHGRSDEAVAAEALANHMRHNNSFVYDLFQALYRSSLSCQNCRRQSNTFDPFLCVSLPIPQRSTRPVYVTVVYLDARPKQVRIGLTLNILDTVKELREMLASDTGTPKSQLILTEIYYDGFHRTFSDEQPLTDIHENDNIYAIETPPALTLETGPQAKYVTSSFILILLLNRQGVGNQGKRFGSPMVLQVPRDSTFSELQQDILHNMIDNLRTGVIQQRLGVLFRLRVVDGIPGKCYLPHDVDHPLFMPTVDRALTTYMQDSGPQHIKLIAEWDVQTKQCMMVNSGDVELVEEHESTRQVKQSHTEPSGGSLDDCFQLYTQEERLGPEDSWHCPNCKKRQDCTVKRLNLWSLPDILVVHLKRFKQSKYRRTKLNTLIDFPVHGLDMRRHVYKSPDSHNSSANGGPLSNWSPWRRNRRTNPGPEDYIYDLYAVCNHYGNMMGGHYTAFCKNAADGHWYSFDDAKVSAMQEDEVVTSAAYLCFYQRRTLVGMSSSASSSSSMNGDHWVYRISNFGMMANGTSPHTKNRSMSQEILSEEPVADGEEQFVRSTNPYATLRSPRTRTASASERLVNGDRSLQGSFTRLTESPTHDLSIISDSPTKEVSSLLSKSPHGPTEFPHVTDSPSQDIASQISGLSQESQRTQESSRESPHHKIQYPTWDYSQCTYLAESCV